MIGVERLLGEIETTANLQHPHILPLRDSGAVDGTAFYVLPFVEGATQRNLRTVSWSRNPICRGSYCVRARRVVVGDDRLLMIKLPPAPPVPLMVMAEHWCTEFLANLRP